jgi:hypothetical protein
LLMLVQHYRVLCLHPDTKVLHRDALHAMEELVVRRGLVLPVV